jgi:Rap1a immunity proteins
MAEPVEVLRLSDRVIAGCLRGIVLFAALMLSCESVAEGLFSANEVMPGCRPLVTNSQRKSWDTPFCAGLISALAHMHVDSCLPREVTQGQIARVVVQYIDNRPARMHEDFRDLALEAMKAAWPCPR